MCNMFTESIEFYYERFDLRTQYTSIPIYNRPKRRLRDINLNIINSSQNIKHGAGSFIEISKSCTLYVYTYYYRFVTSNY